MVSKNPDLKFSTVSFDENCVNNQIVKKINSEGSRLTAKIGKGQPSISTMMTLSATSLKMCLNCDHIKHGNYFSSIIFM